MKLKLSQIKGLFLMRSYWMEYLTRRANGAFWKGILHAAQEFWFSGFVYWLKGEFQYIERSPDSKYYVTKWNDLETNSVLKVKNAERETRTHNRNWMDYIYLLQILFYLHQSQSRAHRTFSSTRENIASFFFASYLLIWKISFVL